MAVGDSVALEIKFATKRYQSRVHKSPRIETNEEQPVHRVHITADVVPRPDSTWPIVIKPYKLDISQFGPEIRDEMSYSITNVSDERVRFTLIDLPAGLFTIELPTTLDTQEYWGGRLRLYQKAIPMSFETSVTIQLSDEDKTRFTIPVKRNIRELDP